MRFDAFLDAQAEEGVGEPSPDLASSDRPRNRPTGRVGAGHPAAGARRCPAVPVARPVRLRPPSASSSGGGVRSLPGAFPEVSHRPPSAASVCRGARLAHAAGACASGWVADPSSTLLGPSSEPSRSLRQARNLWVAAPPKTSVLHYDWQDSVLLQAATGRFLSDGWRVIDWSEWPLLQVPERALLGDEGPGASSIVVGLSCRFREPSASLSSTRPGRSPTHPRRCR